MHSKSDSIEIMINDKADEVIEKLFQSLLSRYQIGLEISMKDSDVMFGCVHLLYYKCHKINFKLGGSYLNSPDWIKNKKATTNLINKKGNKWFQYTITVALNHEKIGEHPERITGIKSFIHKYNWKGINYSLEKDDWKKFERNNLKIALHVLYAKKEKLYPAYVSKHVPNSEKQVILSMISDGEG